LNRTESQPGLEGEIVSIESNPDRDPKYNLNALDPLSSLAEGRGVRGEG